MQKEPAERMGRPGRGRRVVSGQSRAEPRGTEPRASVSCVGSSEEEMERLKEHIAVRQQKEKQAGDRGRRAEREGEEEERGRDRSRGDGGKGRRAASEGGGGSEESRRLRWRINELEKKKLQLTSGHNQELCRLQAELARLRSLVERSEAQRAELQRQLTESHRDVQQAKRSLSEREVELQKKVEELQKALDVARQAWEEDQHVLQQEVEERDTLIQSFGSENRRLHQLLQEQEEALEESERRLAEAEKERQQEAEAGRRRADELTYLTEREEKSRRERELSEQTVKSLESSIEAERAAHLQSKFNAEVIQLRVRDLEAAMAVERAGQQEAQRSLELLRAQFREVEQAYGLERERSGGTEHALQGLQNQLQQCRADMTVALETERKTTSDLTKRLEEETRRHANTHSLLEQSECETASCLKHIRDAVRQHRTTQPAEDDGKPSPPTAVLQLLGTTLGGYRSRLEDADKQVHNLLLASERLQDENQTLRQLTSDQRSRIDESREASVKLEDEVARLRQESSDWSTRNRGLQAEWQRERDERTAEVQDITDRHKQESTARLSFLYCLYQRLLAGCVLLHQPQSILGHFTWKELCDVIGEQVDQLTSDLRKANDEIAHLQSVCDKKSVCVRELQRSQECVLSRLEESVRRREEAWNSRHTHTMNQLEQCRSQCDSLQDCVSSLELLSSSLTSDLSRSRRDSSSFLLGCTLLAGALRHAHLRLSTLSEQKALLCRRLAGGELLEEQVRRLADALGGQEGKEEEVKEGERRRRRAVRRWRRSVCAVLAVGRWRSLARKTTVLFRLERGGGASAVCVCGSSATATREGQNERRTAEDDSGGGDIVRWLRSKRFSSSIRSCMSGLQGALVRSGSSHPHVISAARSGLSRLLDVLLNQSASGGGEDQDTLSGRLRLGLSRLTPPQPDAKALVSSLQQHFLLFSQRLHAAEVERRGLRLEVANLKRGLRQEREEPCRTGFQSVCAELRESLSREKVAQTLIQEQSEQLNTLQRRVDTPTAEDTDTQRTLSQTTQALTEARRDVSRKERSLRILGKHLSGVQRERRQLEEKLQRAEDELRDATRRQDRVISCMKAAETSYKQVRDSLVQSQRSLTAQPRPLQLPLEMSDAGSFIGAPEVAACQSLLSVISQLWHTCSSRIDWLEQEVSAHRSHVTALRSELQDACLRDNLAFVPVAEFPGTVLFADMQTPPPIPLSDSSKVSAVTLSSAPLETNPAPPAKLSPTLSKPKTKEKKTKRSRGHLKSGGII